MQQEICFLLKACGLNDTEANILIFVVQNGESYASNIAKKLHIKRPTVYAALENLIQRELILKNKQSPTTTFSSMSPEVIADILKYQAQAKYNSIQSTTNKLKSSLKGIQKESYEINGFTIERIESQEMIYSQLGSTIYEGNFRGYFNPNAIFYRDDIWLLVKDYLKHTSLTKPHIKEIAVVGPYTERYFSHVLNPNHQMKFIDKPLAVTSDIIISDDSVLITNYFDHTQNGIRIKNKEFIKTQQAWFDLIWGKL